MRISGRPGRCRRGTDGSARSGNERQPPLEAGRRSRRCWPDGASRPWRREPPPRMAGRGRPGTAGSHAPGTILGASAGVRSGCGSMSHTGVIAVSWMRRTSVSDRSWPFEPIAGLDRLAEDPSGGVSAHADFRVLLSCLSPIARPSAVSASTCARTRRVAFDRRGVVPRVPDAPPDVGRLNRGWSPPHALPQLGDLGIQTLVDDLSGRSAAAGPGELHVDEFAVGNSTVLHWECTLGRSFTGGDPGGGPAARSSRPKPQPQPWGGQPRPRRRRSRRRRGVGGAAAAEAGVGYRPPPPGKPPRPPGGPPPWYRHRWGCC